MGISSQRVSEAISKYSYRFYDRPRYEPFEAYEEAREEFVDRLSDVEGIVSVYESGDGPGVPGISDIDMVVVVEDDVADPERLRQRIEDAKIDEYFFFHGPDVVTRSTFPDYYSVLPVPKELYLYAGEDLNYESRTDEYNKLVYLVDSFNTTYPGEFLEFLFFPGIHLADRQLDIAANDFIDLLLPGRVANHLPVHVETRMALHRLNSLRNDMALFCETADTESAVLSEFDESITDLRDRWFDEPQNKQQQLLVDRLADAVTACFEFAQLLDEHLQEEEIVPSITADKTTTNNRYLNTHLQSWSAEIGEQQTLTRFGKQRVRSISLPTSFLVNKLARENNQRVPTEYRKTIKRRDLTAEARMQSLSTYLFHPLRDTYMAVVPRAHRLKANWVL